MARKLSSLVVPLQGDASGFRRELLSARATAARETATISDSFNQLGRSISRRQGEIKNVSGEILRFGSDAAPALAPVQGVVDSLLGAFRGGGPLILGISAVAMGIGALASKIKEAKEEAEHLEALHRVTGITRGEVEGLRDSLADAGVKLSTIEASSLAKVAKEAQLSKEEILGNVDAIRALATLEGISFENAAVQFLQGLKQGAEESKASIQAIQDAIHTLRHGQDDPVLAAGEARIKRLQEEREEIRETIQGYQDAEEAAYQAMLARPTKTNRRAYAAATAARVGAEEQDGERFLTGIDSEIQAIEDRLVSYQLERERIREAKEEEAKRAKAAEAWRQRQAQLAAEAEARERQALDTAIASAQARGDKEGAINAALAKRLALLDDLSAKSLISDEDLETERTIAIEDAERQRQELVRDSLRQQWDYELAHKERLAGLTESRLDDLELALEKELEAVKRQLEDEVLSVEEAERRKADIRGYYATLRERTAEREAQAERDKEQRLAAKAQADEAQAYNQGFAIAGAMTSGLRDGMETGDIRSILKGILGVVTLATSIFGGPVLGAAVGGFASIFAGFFRDGGYVDGPRSAKRDNLVGFFEAGEFVVNREATARNRGLLEFINSGGSLDLAGAFAGGGMVGGAPAPALPGTTNVYVAALDPKQTAEVLANRIEPAQRQRGISRQDEALISTVRTRVNRRTGRRP